MKAEKEKDERPVDNVGGAPGENASSLKEEIEKTADQQEQAQEQEREQETQEKIDTEGDSKDGESPNEAPEEAAAASDETPEEAADSKKAAPVEDSDDDDEDFDKDFPPSTGPITADMVSELRKLIFASDSKVFPPSWCKQGFEYLKDPSELSYGIVQLEGGPCGVIASVQAFILSEMLFSRESDFSVDTRSGWETPSRKEQKQLVAKAVAGIIWGCAQSKVGRGEDFMKIEKKRPAKICHLADKPVLQRTKALKHDGVTEFIEVTTVFNFDDCYQCVKNNISMFMKKDGGGVVCLAYSCLLSRGLDQITKDMDANFGMVPKMIGHHGYAEQEFVNLMLTGAATSNVFDGEKRLEDESGSSNDCVVLGGIGERGKVGFLTLFEAFKNVEVGANYKNPKTPVWVVCSESHYSVLFSPIAKAPGGGDDDYLDLLSRPNSRQ